MKFYQERLEKHKEFLKDQKFILLKEINKMQHKLQLIESKHNQIKKKKFDKGPLNIMALLSGLNLISLKINENEEQESTTNDEKLNSVKMDKNNEKNENYEKYL